MKSEQGRKPLNEVENLEIGEKIELKGRTKVYHYQYAYTCRKRFPKMGFKIVKEKTKVYIQREK